MFLAPMLAKVGVAVGASGAGAAASGLQVVGTALSAVSGLASANYQASVAKANAKIAEQNAARAQQEAAVAAQEQDWQAAAEIGQMVASMGASGLLIDSPSNLAKQRSARQLAAKDRGYTIYRGATEGANYSQQAATFRADAGAARTAGILGVGSSLISGATKINSIKASTIF